MKECQASLKMSNRDDQRPEETSILKEKLEQKSREKKESRQARYQSQDKVPDRLAQRG